MFHYYEFAHGLVHYTARVHELIRITPALSAGRGDKAKSALLFRYTALMNAAVSATPYEDLTPDAVLSAVESTGRSTDGRLLALNSYENRVYQVGIEDGLPLVAKFYRPGRWTDAAILEEHAFAGNSRSRRSRW